MIAIRCIKSDIINGLVVKLQHPVTVAGLVVIDLYAVPVGTFKVVVLGNEIFTGLKPFAESCITYIMNGKMITGIFKTFNLTIGKNMLVHAIVKRYGLLSRRHAATKQQDDSG